MGNPDGQLPKSVLKYAGSCDIITKAFAHGNDFYGHDEMEKHFTLGIPFKLFDQLMGVLPTADWKARTNVVKLLKHLKKELTLLVVSHDLKELSPLVDKSWRMEMGRVLREEPLPV